MIRMTDAATDERHGNVPLGDMERTVLAKIAELPDPYRTMSERLHALIHDSAPALVPKTWYGMPANTLSPGLITDHAEIPWQRYVALRHVLVHRTLGVDLADRHMARLNHFERKHYHPCAGTFSITRGEVS